MSECLLLKLPLESLVGRPQEALGQRVHTCIKYGREYLRVARVERVHEKLSVIIAGEVGSKRTAK